MTDKKTIELGGMDHLFSERALDRRDHGLEHGTPAPIHAWCFTPGLGIGW